MLLQLPTIWLIVYGVAFLAYIAVMYRVGWVAEHRIDTVDDYLVAGRRLSLPMATGALVATWFGAEVLLQTTDEVYHHGLRSALMDPLGTGACLILAGWLVARPMWKMRLTTVPEYFQRRFGKSAEIIAAVILVPSYFGWVASQYEGLAHVFSLLFGFDLTFAIIAIAVIGTGYTVMGGMWSITWTDAIQLLFIWVGLLLIGYQVLLHLGKDAFSDGVNVFWNGSTAKKWQVISQDEFAKDLWHAIGAVSIGMLGNIPVQDLMQRMFAAKSARVAQQACWLGGVLYIVMAAVPISIGLVGDLVLPEPIEGGLLTAVAVQLLSPFVLLIFLLAVISAVLSTISSATMAAATILGQNLFLQSSNIRQRCQSQSSMLTMQRWCVVIVAVLSLMTAFSGEAASKLLRDAYAMTLVGLFVPLMGGLHWHRAGWQAAITSMLAGGIAWSVHWWFDTESTLGMIPLEYLPQTLQWLHYLPHEIFDTLCSGLGLLVGGLLWPCRDTVAQASDAVHHPATR